MAKPKHDHENIEKLANLVVESYDLDTLINACIKQLMREYTVDKDSFQNDWSNFVETKED